MNALYSTNALLHNILSSKENRFLKQVVLVLAGVVVLALSAQLSIPFQPVPLTFQSATVVLIGMAYGPRLGTIVVATYLMAGLMGLPIYEGFSYGVSTFLGATCGYLVGFLPAAALSGYLAQKGWAKYWASSFAAACLGSLLIFTLGTLVLAQFVGLHRAIEFGFMPFIISEPIKLLAVSAIIPSLWKKS